MGSRDAAMRLRRKYLSDVSTAMQAEGYAKDEIDATIAALEEQIDELVAASPRDGADATRDAISMMDPPSDFFLRGEGRQAIENETRSSRVACRGGGGLPCGGRRHLCAPTRRLRHR